MNISKSQLDYEYHRTKVVSSNLAGDYVIHQADIFCNITINEQTFQAVFQAGNSYLFNDYSLPCPKFEISREGGADELLEIIDCLYESDFDDEDGIIDEQFEEIRDLCPAIESIEDLFEVWQFLRDLTGDVNALDIASNDPEDWEYDEHENEWVPI